MKNSYRQCARAEEASGRVLRPSFDRNKTTTIYSCESSSLTLEDKIVDERTFNCERMTFTLRAQITERCKTRFCLRCGALKEEQCQCAAPQCYVWRDVVSQDRNDFVSYAIKKGAALIDVCDVRECHVKQNDAIVEASREEIAVSYVITAKREVLDKLARCAIIARATHTLDTAPPPRAPGAAVAQATERKAYKDQQREMKMSRAMKELERDERYVVDEHIDKHEKSLTRLRAIELIDADTLLVREQRELVVMSASHLIAQELDDTLTLRRRASMIADSKFSKTERSLIKRLDKYEETSDDVKISEEERVEATKQRERLRAVIRFRKHERRENGATFATTNDDALEDAALSESELDSRLSSVVELVAQLRAAVKTGACVHTMARMLLQTGRAERVVDIAHFIVTTTSAKSKEESAEFAAVRALDFHERVASRDVVAKRPKIKSEERAASAKGAGDHNETESANNSLYNEAHKARKKGRFRKRPKQATYQVAPPVVITDDERKLLDAMKASRYSAEEAKQAYVVADDTTTKQTAPPASVTDAQREAINRRTVSQSHEVRLFDERMRRSS